MSYIWYVLFCDFFVSDLYGWRLTQGLGLCFFFVTACLCIPKYVSHLLIYCFTLLCDCLSVFSYTYAHSFLCIFLFFFVFPYTYAHFFVIAYVCFPTRTHTHFSVFPFFCVWFAYLCFPTHMHTHFNVFSFFFFGLSVPILFSFYTLHTPLIDLLFDLYFSLSICVYIHESINALHP